MSARKTPDPVMAKLSCRHTVEVIGRAVGDRVPCYLCPETKTGAATRTVKQLQDPQPVEPAAKPAGKPGKGKRATSKPPAAPSATAVRRAFAAKKGASTPVRCPGVGQVGLDGPGSTRCPVCSQDAARVKRDGTIGSHKLLQPRGGDQ